ncbi:MAG: recombinase family protein [Phycisphaerae bacterium]|nr:MAG: recombinase family protein [Phycisphaerae bacterium]
MRRKRREPEPQPKQIRCAIYTRKSTEEGLQQDFNSLDAQRDSAEKYIASQAGEGWACLPDQYDDGGFTGGNMERPALQRLLADIDAGKVDCVVVYKVDRLSRSILDFAKIMERFQQRNVSFVSVTQQFNTSTSMGRLMLHVLLSFAQFEREIISERTRDKIAAARRRGKWMGGKPLLGYDLIVTPGGGKLVVNDDEAARVRAIFELYLEHERIAPVLQELDRRAWRTKQWTTRRTGTTRGGRPFDKVTLFRLLTNPAYLGKVRHREDLYDGEHDAIVDEAIWQRAQALLQRNGRTGGGVVKNKYGALLKGLLRCVPCDCAMVHSTSSKGPKRYRYYVCTKAMKRGWYTCPSKSVPAGELERFVVDQIRSIGRDPGVLADTIRQVRTQSQKAIADLERERGTLERDIARQSKALKQHLVAAPGSNGADVAHRQDELRRLETRLTEVRERHVVLTRELVDEREVVQALSLFDPVWESLTPREQARIVQLLVERVDYDGKAGTVAVTFRPTGIKALAQKEAEDAA